MSFPYKYAYFAPKSNAFFLTEIRERSMWDHYFLVFSLLTGMDPFFGMWN